MILRHRRPVAFALFFALVLIAGLYALPALAEPAGPDRPAPGPVPDLPANYARTIVPTSPNAFNPVDVTDRAAVVAHFNANYNAINPAIEWTGNHAACGQGDTSAAFKDAIIDQINFYRRMAGVQDAVLASAADNLGAQKAALLMSVNNNLDHFPPANWTCFAEMTAADPKGSDYAGRSNLYLGRNGAVSIHGYIMDPGSNNTAAGHRGWILYPQRTEFGSGDVPAGNGASIANALYVFGAQSATRQTRDKIGGHEVVAWPPPGYVPYQTVYSRWSFEHPGADFTNATVTMTQYGCPANQSMTSIIQNRGSRLVWVPTAVPGLNPNGFGVHPQPTGDTVYRVAIENATVNGAAATFDYYVIVIDPAAPAPGPLTWDGSDGRAWNACQNWSTNRTPLPFDDVTISPASQPPVIDGGEAVARNLTIAEGASLSLTGGELTIYGNWTEEGSGHTTAYGGAITFAGSSGQSVALGGQSTLPAVTVKGGAAVAFTGVATIDGNLTLMPGASLRAESLRVAGNWDDRNLGIGFIPGISTVIFDGATQAVDKVTKAALINEDFNANTSEFCSALPTGWSDEQNAGPGFLWCGTAANSVPGMAVRWVSTPDGWLFTPHLPLAAGVAYSLTYKYMIPYSDSGTFVAYVAAAPTAAAMLATTPLHAPVAGSSTPQTATVPFTVPIDGDYYVGFRSQGDGFGAIDDVTLSGQGQSRFHNVTIAAGATTFLKDLALSGDLTVHRGASAALLTGTVVVEGNVTNNGILKQQRNVAGGSVTRFLHIQNGAGSATRYAGVDITPNAPGLGSTWVTVRGNQGLCNVGDELVRRCFDIAPATAQPATVRFWYLHSEKGDHSLTQVNAFHWNGAAWDGLTAATPPRGTVGGYEWVEAVNVGTFSPFGLGAATPSGPPAAEMDLIGNGAPITSGDSTPNSADHTDFGRVAVDGDPLERIFTIVNADANVLYLTATEPVTVTGSGAAHFQVVNQPALTITSGHSTTFTIRYAPSASGVHTATVIIPNNDGDENPYTFTIRGTGTRPLFLPTIVR